MWIITIKIPIWGYSKWNQNSESAALKHPAEKWEDSSKAGPYLLILYLSQSKPVVTL